MGMEREGCGGNMGSPGIIKREFPNIIKRVVLTKIKLEI